MDEKEAEARPVMGTIFLVVTIILVYIWPMADRTYVSNTHAHVRMPMYV